MSDLADAGGPRLLRQVSDDLFAADFRRSRLLILDVCLRLMGWCVPLDSG